MNISFSFRKIACIYVSIILSIFSLTHANEFIVVDEEFYEGEHPPIVIEREPGYVELYIAPTDENGVSYNRFKKINITGLKKLFLINSTEKERVSDVNWRFDWNDNLEYSLSDPQEANKIQIEITDPDPLADSVLESLIRTIGHKAEVSIYSHAGSIEDRLKASRLSTAGDAIVIDEDFYATRNAYPPLLIEISPGYFELHIAPVSIQGVSLNKFKKFDTSQINGLFLINSTQRERIKNLSLHFNVNKNFEHSLYKNPEAEIIRIEIHNDDPSAGTFLQGLIGIVGEPSYLEILSDQGVSIDGAFFTIPKHLYIESLDSRDFTQCESMPCARNIRIGTWGMHANGPVTLNSKSIVIDGPIRIPGKNLFFDAQGKCMFTKNGSIEELGGLGAKCKESFANYGNINIQGIAKVETENFTNEASWNIADWTPQMVNALPEEVKRGYMIIDRWQHLPFDDIPGRKFEKMCDKTGMILAHNYFINITKGSFQNRDGAQMYATAPNGESSQIIAEGEILNTYKQAYNHAGYYKQGFDYISSVLNFSGNTLLYSHANRVKNHGSTINVKGDCTVRAGTNIENENISGEYVNTLFCKPHGRPKGHPITTDIFKKHQCAMPGKGKVCLGQHGSPFVNELENLHNHNTAVNKPAIFLVQGGRSYREALGSIKDIGSIFYAEKSSLDKAGGKYILEGRPIDPVSKEKVMAEVRAYVASNSDGAIAKNFVSEAALITNSGNKPYGMLGIHYTKGTSETKTEQGIDLTNGAIFAAEENVSMKTSGQFNMEGHNQAYLAEIRHSKNSEANIHDFVAVPTIVTGNNIDIKAENADIYIKGGQLLALDDITLSANNIDIEPLTAVAEDSYWAKEKTLLNSKTITVKSTVSETVNSVIHGKGKVTFNAGILSIDGSIIKGDLETELNVDVLKLKAHLIDHYRITDTKSKGFFFPGVGNMIIDLSQGNFSSRSAKNNIGIVAALDRLFNTESASDMAPSILAAAEAYTIADGFASEYLATGSQMAAMTSVVLDQLNIEVIGGVPVPSSVGYGETKTHKESKWQEAVFPIISGGNVKINARVADIDGAQLKADKDFEFTVTENLFLNGQPITASESFRQDGKSATFSFNKRGVNLSGNHRTAKANSQIISQVLPEIIAGNSVVLNIGGDAEVEGVVRAPKIRVKVGGQLLLKTVQDKGEGSSSQKSINAGVTITASGAVIPNGGFQFGDGDWFRNWANQQASIIGTDVEIDVKTLILEGARIIAELGHVNADSIEYKNIINTYESDFSEFGVDTNFLTFLMDPVNSHRVTSAANAIKGMAVFGNDDESEYQDLLATISQKLEVNTKSNIDGLNRDDSKAEGPVRRSSHKFSLALPVVDWNQLGEGLERIGMTARDINQKMQDTFLSAKQEANTPEEKANIEEVQAKYNGIAEKIEQSNLPEEKKVEITMRIFLLMNEAELESGQYFIHAEQVTELENKGTLEMPKLGEGIQQQFMYKPKGGVIVKVEISATYGEDTYQYVAEYFDGVTANDVRQLQSKWKTIAEKVGHGALDFGQGFVMVPIDTAVAVKDGVIMIGELYFDIVDGTFAKKAEAFNSLDSWDQLVIVAKIGSEMGHDMYKGFVESVTTAKGWGGIVGDTVMGAGTVRLAKAVKVGKKLDGVVEGTKDFEIRAEICPREIGIMEREISTITNPLKSQQIPARFATAVDDQILKAGTEAGSGFKHHADIDINLLKKKINLPNDLNNPKLRAKYSSHGKHFGMEGMNFNKQNAELFKQKITDHIIDPETIAIAGEYTRGGVGNVVHYYNPTTKLNVMKDMNGDFISGWKLNAEQIEHLQKIGKIGGGK